MNCHLVSRLVGFVLLIPLLWVAPTCTAYGEDATGGNPVLFSVHDSPQQMVERLARVLGSQPPENLTSAFDEVCRELKLKKEVTAPGEDLRAGWCVPIFGELDRFRGVVEQPRLTHAAPINRELFYAL